MLKALLKTEVTSYLVQETILELNAAAGEGRHITLNWTKAHVGVEGNEKADELAKAGALDEYGGSESS